MLTFASPAGFWALLAIPAILAIHFLQRQSRQLAISTLFLLDQSRQDSVAGRRFEQLRSSIPLWLQLLAALLLAWLLAQPRWTRADSVQRVALVLDGSASMSAFREELSSSLRRELGRLSGAAFRTEYIALDSRSSATPVYHGTEIRGLLDALAAWDPAGGAHDPAPALRVGRGLAGPGGLLVFATDHLREDLPHDARLLAVGQPRDNAGFAGLSFSATEDGEPLWRVLVRNYSDHPQARSWSLRSGNQETPPRALSLEPGEIRQLQGRFPEGADILTLVLEPDAFPLDDSLPLVRPAPKPFSLATAGPPALEEIFAQILSSFEGLVPPAPGAAPDLVLAAHDPLDPRPLPERAIVASHHPAAAPGYLAGRIAAENHPLVAGLNWQGLLARQSPGIPRAENDTVLLWQGERALVFLRDSGATAQLFLNFDLASSNATRLPAFIVMLHRFAGGLRARKVAPETRNFELGQSLELAYAAGESAPPELVREFRPAGGGPGLPDAIPLARAGVARAPWEPGFFEIRQAEAPGLLLLGAAHFADTREADLRQAASRSDLSGLERELALGHSSGDAWQPLWLLALLAALLASWHFLARPAIPESSAHPAA